MRLSAIRPLLAAIALALALAGFYRWQTDSADQAPQQAVAATAVATLNGQAQVLRGGASVLQTVSRDNVYLGDTVRALDNVRLVFIEGTALDMDPGAQISVKAAQEDGTLTLVHLAGRMQVETDNPRFRLESQVAALTVDRARFQVVLSDAGDTYVTSERGLVYSASEGEVVPIAEGESLRTGVGQRAKVQTATPIALPPPPPPPPRTPTPTVTPVPPTQPPQRIHIVTRGDTLSEIAAKYGVTVEAIMKANALDNPNMLYVAQQLIIPQPK
jgi:nucleoid-associated protein YgaU